MINGHHHHHDNQGKCRAEPYNYRIVIIIIGMNNDHHHRNHRRHHAEGARQSRDAISSQTSETEREEGYFDLSLTLFKF